MAGETLNVLKKLSKSGKIWLDQTSILIEEKTAGGFVFICLKTRSEGPYYCSEVEDKAGLSRVG